MKWADIDWTTWQRGRNPTTSPAAFTSSRCRRPRSTILRKLQADSAARLAEINAGRAKKNVGEGFGKWPPREPSEYCFPAELIARKCEPNTPIDGSLEDANGPHPQKLRRLGLSRA